MTKWEILHIPDKIPFKPDEQPTIMSLLQKLNNVAPMENYRHIKRVWKKNSVEGGPQVCRDIKRRVEQQCKLWPTSYQSAKLGITGFNEEDAESIFHFMKMALELAKAGHCTDEVVNAAAIIDPSTRQVIASDNDQTCQSSTSTVNNTSFECGSVEQNNIATSHQSDADDVAIKETLFSNSSLAVAENKESYSGVSCLYPWNWTEQNSTAGNAYSWHPLQHAALVAIKHASSRDSRLFPGWFSF
ncbi:hypothetical protein MKX01_030422 [Papaver californicum]|nr:hypothetical protein MKX01_030422 [Papaver californicum]